MLKLLRYLTCYSLLLTMPVFAEEEAAAEETRERCVSTSRISHTDVINDQAIAFHMKGKDIYLNELPRRCSGLHFNRGISYRTQSSQLCNVDVITVLYGSGGISRGATCGLGHFRLISKNELKTLKTNRGSRRDTSTPDTQGKTDREQSG